MNHSIKRSVRPVIAAIAVVITATFAWAAAKEFKWEVHDMKRPQPPVVTPAPQDNLTAAPSDATVLFDGTNLDAWTHKGGPAKWKVENGYFEITKKTGQIKTKEAFGSYPWFQTEGDPFVRLGKPAADTRFGLVTTGGYSITGEQEPMLAMPNLGGATPEIREIPIDVDQTRLEINQPGYDHRFAKEDVNVNLPLDRLRELAASGEIGSVAPMTQVLMGLVVDVAPLIQETIPELVSRLRAAEVEAALLVPS